MKNTKFFSHINFNSYLIILVALFFIKCSTKTEDLTTPVSKEPEIDKINLCYNEFRGALIRGDGLTCSNLVNDATIKYYQSILDLVLTADSSKLVLSSLLDKFNVLAIRQSVDWNRLRAMNGNDLLSHAIENGMIGKNFDKLNLGDVQLIDKIQARAELVVDNKKIGKHINFDNENGQWKIDLINMLNDNEANLKKMISKFGVSDHEGLLILFEKTFGNKPSKEIWLPVKWYNK